MPEKSREIKPSQEGLFNGLMTNIRLIMRLMADGRVSPFAKLLPLGAMVYLLVPDLFLGPVDDAIVFWIGNTMFLDLCPPAVIQEHRDHIRGFSAPLDGREPDGEVIDAQARDVD